MLYHILTKDDYKKYESIEYYEPTSFKSVGFIHLAYKEQVQQIIDCFFVGATELYLLKIDINVVARALRDEPPVGIKDDGKLYPHLYSSLCKQAVVKTIKLVADSTGALKVKL